MSDRLELLKPLLNDKIRKLALKRIADSEKLFNGEKLKPHIKMPEADVKIALLLAEYINPHEDFSKEEWALMKGISSKTLRKRLQTQQLEQKNKR